MHFFFVLSLFFANFVALLYIISVYMELCPGYYRHFKGNYYYLLGTAQHSESLEEMVVYRALYGEQKLWVRPASMWTEKVERDGYCGPRFYPVPESEVPQTTKVEYFPIVTESGEVVGRATRSECHSGSHLLHPVVHLHVFSSAGSLYLQRRAATKDLLPGYWDTAVGGHVDFGETIREALARETREEIGITRYQPEHIETYRYESQRETEMVHVYRTTYDGPFEIDPVEVSEGRFWTLQELREAIGQGVLTPNLEMELMRFHFV